MITKIEDLKIKRDQLNARIQQAEARARASEKKAQDRIKVLVGAMLLEKVKAGHLTQAELLTDLNKFLKRESEREAVLGKNGRGSETFHELTNAQA